MSIPNAPTPPLLLTKRLNHYLHAHHCSHLPTLLLTTSHGKILAHASTQPVAQLRTHATVAASLLAIHTSSSVALSTALPGSRTPPDLIHASPAESDDEEDEVDDDDVRDLQEEEDARSVNSGYEGTQLRRDSEREEGSSRARRERRRGESGRRGQDARHAIQPGTITVQLTGGTVVIRRLNCGLLLVCVGPPATAADLYAHDHHHHPPSSESNPRHANHHHHHSSTVGSPSEVDSLISAGGQTSSSSIESSHAGPVAAMRRRVAELARRLEEKLGTLKVPGEGIGIE